MRIKIDDPEKCKNCTQRTCYLIDTITKSDFMNLKTEHYTCPVKRLTNGPADEQISSEYIDFKIRDDNECVYCYSCVIHCSQENLLIKKFDYDAREDFLRLRTSSAPNTIALSYLNHIFEFAANTNLIKTISFDGAVLTKSGERCLVEVDINNDSLECCRRLLADIILFNHNKEKKIKNGLLVLNDFPKKGSRDVFTLIEKIKEIQSTSDFNIYITTFSLLRYYARHINASDYELDDLLFNPSMNKKEEYLQKLLESNIITQEVYSKIFEDAE